MTPIAVPSPAGDCFAMYAGAPGPAVLMCPPFGDEALKTARVWRDLAVRLGEHGLATLRFDLPGTGNSAGEPTDPDRVEAWRAAVRACVAWLATRHAGRVILFGHRFGALLALDAVTRGVAAERLVLLDPPASGTAMARHLRARSRLEQHGPLPEGSDYIQACGVPLSTATLNAIAELPGPITVPDLPPSLLVLNELPSSPSPWPDRLREHGSAVETIAFEGHADFVPYDAFNARKPERVLDAVADYLVRTTGPIGPTTLVAGTRTPEFQFDGYAEIPIWFGAERQMFGILCRPEHRAKAGPALLLPTTGADPCCGMARMWTDLSRRLAREGTTSLRFDMRGVGESGGTLGDNRLAAMYHTDRVADLSAAIDALVTRGFDAVNVVGYCAGAYAAWHAALRDLRISAIMAGNLLYLTRQPSLADDVLHSRPGSSLIGSQGSAIARVLPAGSVAALRRIDDGTRRLVPRRLRVMLRKWGSDAKETRWHLKKLVGRGCTVSLVMAHDDHGHVRLRRAFGEEPRLPEGVEVTVIPEADHQFSDRRHRAHFLDLAASFALLQPARLPVTELPCAPARLLETA